MRTLITGGTGWIGKNLISHFERPTITSRNRDRAMNKMGEQAGKVIAWDPTSGPIDSSQLEPLDSVINLMGDSIADGRWNAEKKDRIFRSRVVGTANLVDSILESGHPLPECFISASAVGYYGDCGDEEIDESRGPGDDFLADVCQKWELAAKPLRDAGVRVVWLRIGIVLGSGGGALSKMLVPFRLGMGGKLGSGRQWMSWIHLHDLIELILFTAKNPQASGPINAVSPSPVRNFDFTKLLARVLHRPAVLPVPKPVLRIALGQFAEFLCASQRCIPGRAKELGFEFQFPELESALQSILTNANP